MGKRGVINGLLLTFILLPIICYADWTQNTIGPYSRYYEVKVGDGRNDGVQRLYCCCYNGHVVEWSYGGNNWTMVDCGAAPQSADNRLISLWIGDGRGDGVHRIYSACADGNIYEFSYEGGIWVMSTVGTPGVFYAGQVIGQPRNDDLNRVCAGGWNTPVREYTWNGTSWDAIDISAGNRYIWPLDIAVGRNDGVYRIYAPDWYQYYLREYSWNGFSYDEMNVVAPQPLVKAVVGPGRDDGMNRVYAAGKFGHIHEFSYGTGNWQRIDIHPTAPLRSRYGLCFGQTKSDGVTRLYSVAQGGDIREHSWDGDVWVDSIIDAISGATVDIATGRGRDDDTVRVYVTSASGLLYEFTNSSPYVGIESFMREPNGIMLTIQPNPFTTFSSITYSLPRSGKIKLTLHNISGMEVCRLVDDFQAAGSYAIRYGVHDRYGMRLPSGVYFCKLELDGTQSIEKIVSVN
ncbi:MAG: T9SS type A sorting domain-containing protein [bacterium]